MRISSSERRPKRPRILKAKARRREARGKRGSDAAAEGGAKEILSEEEDLEEAEAAEEPAERRNGGMNLWDS